MSKKKKKKNANKNEYSSRVRRAEQCWLIGNLVSLTTELQTEKLVNVHARKHAWHTHHISIAATNKHRPDDNSPEEIIGKYFIGPEIATLFDLKTHELSAILPRLNLYRVQTDPKTGKVTETEEFYFDSHVSKKNVANLMSGKSERFGEAGVMGVNWQLLGGQPAEVKRYVQVDVEFFFSSISILTNEGSPDRLSYLDLFRRRGPSEGYRLRLDVGWHLPEKSSVIFKSQKRAEEVRKALAKSNQTMWLQLRNHDLKFNQNGTVNLTIQYYSSLEYDLQKINVIQDMRKKKDKKKIEDDLKRAEKIYKEMSAKECEPKKKTLTGLGFKNTWNYNSYLANKKKMKMRLDFAQKVQGRAGFAVLREINRVLHEPIAHNGAIIRSRVFQLRVPSVELGYTDGNVVTDEGYFWGIGKKTGGQNIKKTIENYGQMLAYKRPSIQPPLSGYAIMDNVSYQLRKAAGKKKVDTKSLKEYKKIMKKLDESLLSSTKKKSEWTTFKYCFLGDIIDAVIMSCLNIYGAGGTITKTGGTADPNLNSILSNMKIVFGTITLPTYKSAKIPGTSISNAAGVTSGRTIFKGAEHTIPLSDLPISYNLFNAWFIRNVIDAGKSTFLLKDFIRLLLIELVNAAVGNECFVEQDKFFAEFARNRVEMSFHTVRIPNSNGGPKEVFTKSPADESLSNVPIYKKRLSTKYLDKLKFSAADPDTRDVTMTNYLFINAVNQAMNRREKNRARDMERGIFHLNIAQNSGIVRSISFSKTGADYLEESLLENSKTNRELEVFRRVYNADVECYGNASFLPGQMIYIDPTTVGMGDPAKKISTARALGLGGYYLVIKVTSSIKRGEFYTNFTARWVGFGDGEALFPSASDKAKKRRKAAAAKKAAACKGFRGWIEKSVSFKSIGDLYKYD